MREPPERILHACAEGATAEHVVIKRDAEIELPLHFGFAAEEVDVVAPAGEEKFPLQIGELEKAGAFFCAHAGFFKGHEEGGDDTPFGVAQGEEQVEGFLGVGWGFAGQADDKSAEGEPVVAVQ